MLTPGTRPGPPEEGSSSVVLSITSTGMYFRCPAMYKLHYIDGHRPQIKAPAWFGSQIHRIVQIAYHGLPLRAAHDQVWQRTCGPVLSELEAWIPLEEEHRSVHGGKSWSAAGRRWREAHPDYIRLSSIIRTYQQTALSSLRFDERKSLAECYRRSTLLAASDPSLVLLENAMLSEGQWLQKSVEAPHEKKSGAVTGPNLWEDADEDEAKGESYTLLHGQIGVRVVGVPDVVTYGGDGLVYVADYKTGMPLTEHELQKNIQLAVYTELLRQNGLIFPDQEVRIGHIYLTEVGIEHLWTDTRRHPEVIKRAAEQFVTAAARIEAGEFPALAGLLHPYLAPCSKCDYTQVCPAFQV